MGTLSKMSDFIFKVLFLLTTLRPFPYLPILNIAWRLLWLCWLVGITYLSLYWHVSSKDTSVGGLIGIALFVSNAFANMLSICEAVFRLREYQRGRRLCAEVDNIFAHLLDLHKSATALRQCSRRSFAVFLAVSGCEALKMCLHLLHSYSPLYWYSLPTVIGLRMRYLQAFGIALQLNMRIDQLQFALEKLITHNVAKQPKYRSDIWRPYELWEYEQLNALRLIYGRLYESFVCLNGYFGWTGLTICNAAIFEFTCYAYWTFRALYKRQHYHRILYNGTTSLSLMVCVAALFLSAELSAQKSRQIGCIMFKLVKPMGNKSYNDLVTDFSLQTLHQQYIITAKQFFNLNLNLLGSMVASIVTYLVILIQFMFAEKNKSDRNLILNSVVDYGNSTRSASN